MDRLERVFAPDVTLIEAFKGWQSSVWTAMPGTVIDFDPADMTCSVQLTIQLQVQGPSGDFRWESISPLVKCPVVLPSGGGCILTVPIKKDDEVLVVFASRCIDAWWQSGGIGNQVELRMHDLSDGFAIPGPRSVPKAITNYSDSEMQLRSDDGSVSIGLNPETGAIRFKGAVTFENPVVMQQGLAVTGALTANGVNVGNTHRHSTSTNPSGFPT